MAKMIPFPAGSDVLRLVCDHPQDALADSSITPEEREALRCRGRQFSVVRFVDGHNFLVCTTCGAEHRISDAVA